MADKLIDSFKGYYRCEQCGNREIMEREVYCWKCGKGEMLYVDIAKLEADFDLLRVRMKPLEPEFAEILNKHFWELLA